MAGSRCALAFVACVVVVMALAQCATARRLTVGGSLGWSEQGLEFGRDPNFFQNWAHRNFPVHTLDELGTHRRSTLFFVIIDDRDPLAI